MEINIIEAKTETDFNAWNNMIVNERCGNFYITTNWLNAYTEFGMFTKYLLAANSANEFVGGVPLMIYRLGPLCWIIVPYGPFSIQDDEQIQNALLDSVEMYAKRIHAAFIQVLPLERSPFDARWQAIADENSLPYSPDLPASVNGHVSKHLQTRGYVQATLFNLLPMPTAGQIVDLSQPDILSSFRSRTTAYIRRTIKSNKIEVKKAVTLEALHEAFNIIKENVERYGSTYRPWTVFKAAVWPGITNNSMVVLTAYLDSEPCASILVGLGGGIGSYISGGSKKNTDQDGLRPAYLLHFLAMQEVQRRGWQEYDLTSVVHGGVEQMKRSFAPTYYHLREPYSKILSPALFKIYQLVNSQFLSRRRRMRRIFNALYGIRSFFQKRG